MIAGAAALDLISINHRTQFPDSSLARPFGLWSIPMSAPVNVTTPPSLATRAGWLLSRLKSMRSFAFGPGPITGVADDDPSGIATYSQAGQQFGLNTLCDAGRLSSDGGNSTRLDSHHAYGGRSTQDAELRMMVP